MSCNNRIYVLKIYKRRNTICICQLNNDSFTKNTWLEKKTNEIYILLAE